jgi:predicted PurR-regulated permease PerM
MDRKLFGTLLAFTALLLYLAAVISILFPFLRALLWAGIIGLLTYPFYKRLYAALNKRRNLAAGIMTPAVMIILVIPVVSLIVYLATQGPEYYSNIEPMLSGDPAGIWNRVISFPPLQFLIDIIKPYLGRFGINLQETLKLIIQMSFDFLVNFSTTIVKKSLSFTLQLVIMALTLFFIYRDGENFTARLLALIPLKDGVKGDLITTVKNVLIKVLYGLFLACLIQGLLASLGYWLAGLAVPVLLGAATAVTALIPLVGTALVWGPAALFLLLQGKYFQGVFLLAWGGLLIAPSDNLIRTIFMSGKSGTTYISPLVVVLGLLGGLTVFGFLGIVLGPIILCLLFSILELFSRKGAVRELPAGQDHS